jgi:primosomal protein N' (replication factor Y)
LYFYEVAILSSPLSLLTYHSFLDLEKGRVVEVSLRNKYYKAVVTEIASKPDFKTNEILEVSDFFYSFKQLSLAQFISSYYMCSLGEALGLMLAYEFSTHSHAEHGNESQEDCFVLPPRNDDNRERHCERSEAISTITLSQKQNKALAFSQEHKISLLFGDTGSGKTEIYMKYFELMIAQGKRSIFLMPEISLTPQMNQRLEEHFGEKVVMWHSKLTPLQKRKALEKINDGTAFIIAGPRSALFLPVEDLGLIVVDEEHDDSYKSSSRPRYNARDIAIYMGKIYDVPVLLGSATPSLSSYVKFPYVRLKGGHFSSDKEFVYEKSAETLSPLIMQNLKFTLDKKEQSIVFLPTRANFKYLICGDCGHTYECVFCSIGMSIHQKSHALKCHYCNYTQAIPQVCSKCGSGHLTSSRLGTAEAVKNISEELTEARVEQFDRDVITTSAKLKKALKRFNDKESDILVGTQMLSKGHDYHGVTLAVVLGMDNMLNMSDYRAREKALASLIQVSGRSGRAKDAKVIVQSFNEEFFSLYLENYEGFLEDEKKFREGLYPPYKKLCRVLFSHKNGAKAQEQMFIMQENLSRVANIEIVGYGKCAIERVSDKYRFEILLRSDKSTDLIRAINMCRVDLAEIDMDPIEFG